MTMLEDSPKYKRICGDAARVLRNNLDVDFSTAAKQSGISEDEVRMIEEGVCENQKARDKYLDYLGSKNWEGVIQKAAVLLGSYGATVPVGLGQQSSRLAPKMDFLLQLPSLGTMLKGIRQNNVPKTSLAVILERVQALFPDDHTGISGASGYSKIENDEFGSVPFDTLRKICCGLGMPKEVENSYGWVISEYIRRGLMPAEVSISPAGEGARAVG